MRVLLIDTPTGVVPVSGVANFYEQILSKHRLDIINDRLYERFGITKGPHKTYTHGLLSIATTLKAAGFDVSYIVSFDFILEDATKSALLDVDVVCFSCKTTVINQCQDMARHIKEINPNIKIIMGGPHPTFLPEDVLQNSAVDIVSIGEGEETTTELFNALDKGTDIGLVKGIAFRKDGKVVITEPRCLIDDINTVKWVDYSILPGDPCEYYLYVETRRGCPFNCAYCANPRMWQRKVRTLSPDLAYERLKDVASRVAPNSMIHISNPSFCFVDEDVELCKKLKEDSLGIFFSVDLCASFVTNDRIKTMYDAGCRMFSIGIESASDDVLRANHRPGFDAVISALEKIRATCDAFVKGYFVVGLPGETEDTARTTRDMIMKLLDKNLVDLVCEHVFVPYPGCDVFSSPDKYEYEIYTYDWSQYDSRSFPLPGELKRFSMGKAYVAYIDLIASQCGFYGMNKEDYFSQNFNGENKEVPFLSHKKHLV